MTKEIYFFLDYELSYGVFESKCLAYFVIPDFIQSCHSRDFSETHRLEDQEARGGIHLLSSESKFQPHIKECVSFIP